MLDPAQIIRVLQPMLDALSDPALVLGPDASAERVNAALCTRTGRSGEELFGRGWLAVIDPAVPAASATYWSERLAVGSRFVAALPMIGPHGAAAVEVTAVPLLGCGGRWLATIAPLLPARAEARQGAGAGEAAVRALVDERLRVEEQLRASERRFQIAFDATPLPTTITRLDTGAHLAVNDAFLVVTGYTRDEVIGRSGAEFGMWQRAQREQLIAPLATERRLVDVVSQIRTRDGRVRDVQFSSERIEIDGLDCLLNVLTDITERRAAETALRESDRRKDEFLAMLAHELRNPLAPILTAVHLMREQGDVATPRQREILERQANHLARLLDDLLDIARVSRGKIELQRKPIELARIIDRAVETTRPQLDARRHALAVAVPRGLVVDVDEVRFTQVLTNLLANAARYTPEGGHIAVSAARDGGDAVIQVRDDGIGIAAELLPHVFDLFVQGERARDRSEGGLGLGLTMVRLLTEQHGGRVAAHSDGRGLGTEIALRIAAVPDAADTAPPVVPLPRAATPRRVLLVDDNIDAVGLLELLISAAGHEVAVAHDGLEALGVAERFQPEIAVLDIGLPGIDGYELAGRLRANGAPPELIALTGYGHARDRQLSAAAGFRHHLVKPVDPHRLLDLIAEL